MIGIRTHGDGGSIFDILSFTIGLATVENLSILEECIHNTQL